MDKNYLTIKEASEFMDVKINSIHRWIAKGYLSSKPIGMKKRICIKQLTRFKNERNGIVEIDGDL